jgi:hypothetical protein
VWVIRDGEFLRSWLTITFTTAQLRSVLYWPRLNDVKFQPSTAIDMKLVVKWNILPLFLQIGCNVSDKRTYCIFRAEQGRACPNPDTETVILCVTFFM